MINPAPLDVGAAFERPRGPENPAQWETQVRDICNIHNLEPFLLVSVPEPADPAEKASVEDAARHPPHHAE